MPNRTLTALYDTKDAAEAAKTQLKSAGVTDIDIHNEDVGASATDTAHAAGQATKGFLDKVAGFFGGHEDTHAYAEGVRRGHYLLTAKVDDNLADEATRVLEGSSAVDFDKAQESWRGEGWTGGASATGREGYQAAIDSPTTGAAGFGTPASTGSQIQPQTAATASVSGREGDMVIPIVQEELKVGKREVERGGVRVRSYIVETPVREQVNLREEHVTLERRPVDRAVTNADALLQERTLELTEKAEEAVVAKDAVVREELTLRKDATERTEEIADTVRRTEVDVDDSRTERAAGVSSATTTPRQV